MAVFLPRSKSAATTRMVTIPSGMKETNSSVISREAGFEVDLSVNVARARSLERLAQGFMTA